MWAQDYPATRASAVPLQQVQEGARVRAHICACASKPCTRAFENSDQHARTCQLLQSCNTLRHGRDAAAPRHSRTPGGEAKWRAARARARARAESAKIGKHAPWAQLDPTAQADSKRRQHTDVTRHALGTAPAWARGAQQHGAQPSEEDQAKLQDFRQARASARSKARGARDRAESTAALRLAPGRR